MKNSNNGKNEITPQKLLKAATVEFTGNIIRCVTSPFKIAPGIVAHAHTLARYGYVDQEIEKQYDNIAVINDVFTLDLASEKARPHGFAKSINEWVKKFKDLFGEWPCTNNYDILLPFSDKQQTAARRLTDCVSKAIKARISDIAKSQRNTLQETIKHKRTPGERFAIIPGEKISIILSPATATH